MARPCETCQHPDVAAIDGAIVEGTPMSKISALFRVSEDSLQRHKQEHVPEKLWRSQRVKDLTQGDALMERVLRREQRGNELYDAAWSMYQEARVASDPNTALRAIAEARKVLGESRQTAALLFGRRDVRDLEEKLDALLEQIERKDQRKGYGHAI